MDSNKGFFHRYINERMVIHMSLLGILLWVVIYGLFVTSGWVNVELNYGILIILVPLFLIDAIKTALETFLRKDFHAGKEELYKITVVIPTYNGAKVIEATLVDLLKRFKPCQIIVSSNGSTDNTCEIVSRFKGVRIINTLNPIGKVGAINVALSQVYTKYTLIMDDDVLIGNATFPTNPLGKKYSGIAFRVLPIITNWITHIQSHEYRKSMDIGKVFHNATATVQNISGAIGIFKTSELKRQIEIHTGEFCGEDLQRTLLIHLLKDNKGVVIVDSLVETEVPESIAQLFKQRVYGWNPGMYSNFGNYIRILFKKNTQFILRYDAFYNSILVTLSDPLRLVALPILVFYPFITLLVYIIYVFLESIPYVALKSKEPYWVVFIYPVYGLFSFIARITAFGVFVYRRLTFIFANQKKLDDYRHAHIRHKLSGVIFSQIAVFMLVFGFLTLTNYPIIEQIIINGKLGASIFTSQF